MRSKVTAQGHGPKPPFYRLIVPRNSATGQEIDRTAYFSLLSPRIVAGLNVQNTLQSCGSCSLSHW